MDLNDRLGQKVQSGRAFFATPPGNDAAGVRPAPTGESRRLKKGRRGRSNAVVAADNLGFEKAELGRELTVEVALTEPALRFDEA
jgi:hypothetical protein